MCVFLRAHSLFYDFWYKNFKRMDIYDDTDAKLWSCFIYTILRPPEIVFIPPFEWKIFRYGIHIIIWCFTVLSFLQCLISCIYHLLNNRSAYNLLDCYCIHINIFHSWNIAAFYWLHCDKLITLKWFRMIPSKLNVHCYCNSIIVYLF